MPFRWTNPHLTNKLHCFRSRRECRGSAVASSRVESIVGFGQHRFPRPGVRVARHLAACRARDGDQPASGGFAHSQQINTTGPVGKLEVSEASHGAVRGLEPAREALDTLRQEARTQLDSWTRQRVSTRLRGSLRSGLVRLRLRTATAEPLSSWPGALLAYALAESFEVSQDERDLHAIRSYAQRWMEVHHGKPLPNADYTANGRVLLWLYRLTGAAEFLDEAHRMASFLRELPSSDSGLMPYRLAAPNHIYVDSIGLVAPFVSDYITMRPDPALQTKVLLQTDTFLERAMDSVSGLPYHAFDDTSGRKLGAAGWGRGVGWLVFGIGELVRGGVGKADASDRRLAAYAVLCDRVSALQREDGSFSWLLQAFDGPADSSAGGLICCALASGMDAGVLDSVACSQAFDLGMKNIVSHGTAGRPLELASAECGGLGIYPQTYGVYPWGVAPGLLALARYLRNGPWNSE